MDVEMSNNVSGNVEEQEKWKIRRWMERLRTGWKDEEVQERELGCEDRGMWVSQNGWESMWMTARGYAGEGTRQRMGKRIMDKARGTHRC